MYKHAFIFPSCSNVTEAKLTHLTRTHFSAIKGTVALILSNVMSTDDEADTHRGNPVISSANIISRIIQ